MNKDEKNSYDDILHQIEKMAQKYEDDLSELSEYIKANDIEDAERLLQRINLLRFANADAIYRFDKFDCIKELKLTKKQMHILWLLNEHENRQSIIEELNISLNTYNNHIKNIAMKLQNCPWYNGYSTTENNNVKNPEKVIKQFLRYRWADIRFYKNRKNK